MLATTAGLRAWLESRFNDFELSDEPVKGTYGLIWFLKQREYGNHSFAVKTVPPETLANDKKRLDVEYLRREFRLWLELPNHLNVVPALGFDNAILQEPSGENVTIPVMRMPKLDGSLETWVTSKSISACDRLIAMSQVLNGLMHMYRNGLEGHGDLKPSNLLYSDISGRFDFGEASGWPGKNHPWLVRVADLGWADAWVDLGFTNKAFRQYLAPERLEGHVVPMKSDIFAVGVILAELLLGQHPASNFKKATKSEGNWKKCIEKSEWSLEAIQSSRLSRLISCCLHADANQRPLPEECLEEICNELKDSYSLEIRETLDLWANQSSRIADNEHFAWAAMQTRDLGNYEIAKAKVSIGTRLDAISVNCLDDCENWVALAEAMTALLESEATDEHDRVSKIQEEARGYLMNFLTNVSPSDLDACAKRDDWPECVRPFERFSAVIGRIARMAKVSYDSMTSQQIRVGSYALGALAFSLASEAHSRSDAVNASKYLNEAIEHFPSEPVLYYFRARWDSQNWMMRSMAQNGVQANPGDKLRSEWLAGLKTAIKLDPEWAEPYSLIESLPISGGCLSLGPGP